MRSLTISFSNAGRNSFALLFFLSFFLLQLNDVISAIQDLLVRTHAQTITQDDSSGERKLSLERKQKRKKEFALLFNDRAVAIENGCLFSPTSHGFVELPTERGRGRKIRRNLLGPTSSMADRRLPRLPKQQKKKTKKKTASESSGST